MNEATPPHTPTPTIMTNMKNMKKYEVSFTQTIQVGMEIEVPFDTKEEDLEDVLTELVWDNEDRWYLGDSDVEITNYSEMNDN